MPKPLAHTWRGDWFFYLDGEEKDPIYVVQLGAAFFCPVEDILPFLFEVEKLMAGKSKVSIKDLPKSVDSEPGQKSGIKVPNCDHYAENPRPQTMNLPSVMNYLWPEFILDTEIQKKHDVKKRKFVKPSFQWNVYYKEGEPMEVEFRQLMKEDGSSDPMFHTERLTLPALLERLKLQDIITSTIQI